MDIGRAVMFLRVQHCPVKCPGCDTFYTWNGSEKGESKTFAELLEFYHKHILTYPGLGFILSGGEPLLHYRSEALQHFLGLLALDYQFLSLETSGYAGGGLDAGELLQFLKCFDTVHCSPKITPCLQGAHGYEALTANIPAIMHCFRGLLAPNLVFKFVVRDAADLEQVHRFTAEFDVKKAGHEVQLMPYGIHADEIIKAIPTLIDEAARNGWRITPRLHVLIWGNKRGT